MNETIPIISTLIIATIDVVGIMRSRTIEGKMDFFGTGVLLILVNIAAAIMGGR